MIVLKDIAREFEVDTYPLRMKLRANNLNTDNGRWRWDEDDPELKKVRKLAKALKSSGQTTSG